MEIKRVETDKKRYLDLLLLADEQEDMVDRYLERGTMYVLEDGGDPQQLPRTLFPYPEFFSYEEIQAMDESAIPNELCLYFIHNVWEVTMGNKERR